MISIRPFQEKIQMKIDFMGEVGWDHARGGYDKCLHFMINCQTTTINILYYLNGITISNEYFSLYF